MRLSVIHTTVYRYDQPVMLADHYLRLTPRADSYQALLSHTLTIEPQPKVMFTNLEHDGSICHYLRFQGMVRAFSVDSRFTLNFLPEKNPFDFLVTPDSCLSLPMVYPQFLDQDLKSFEQPRVHSDTIQKFAFEILQESGGNTINFLTLLCQRMKRDFIYEFRKYGASHLPEYTLAMKRGSCRDWAVLYMALARAVGLACRFVSGYFFDENPQNPQLHAWIEVYIPGGGWRGFDPTLGLACYGRHIALVSAAQAVSTTPIQGSYFGSATAKMEVALKYNISPCPVESNQVF